MPEGSASSRNMPANSQREEENEVASFTGIRGERSVGPKKALQSHPNFRAITRSHQRIEHAEGFRVIRCANHREIGILNPRMRSLVCLSDHYDHR